MTAFSTMLAPIVSPLLTLWLAGAYMRVPAGSMALSTVLLPVRAGLACNIFFHRQVARIQPAMPWVSVVAIAAVVVAVASKMPATHRHRGAAHVRRDRFGECDRLHPGLRRGTSLRGLAGRPPHDRYRGGPAERGARLDPRPLQYLSAAVAAPCAVATFWHTITGSLLAMYSRLRSFPAGEDPHTTVRELRRRAEELSPAGG